MGFGKTEWPLIFFFKAINFFFLTPSRTSCVLGPHQQLPRHPIKIHVPCLSGKANDLQSPLLVTLNSLSPPQSAKTPGMKDASHSLSALGCGATPALGHTLAGASWSHPDPKPGLGVAGRSWGLSAT